MTTRDRANDGANGTARSRGPAMHGAGRIGATAIGWLVFVVPLVGAVLFAGMFLVATLVGALRGITPPSTAIFDLFPRGGRLIKIDDLLPLAVLTWAMLGCGVSWCVRWAGGSAQQRWRRGELGLGRWLRRLGLPLVLVAMWFSLAAIWSQLPRPAHVCDMSCSATILGHVPWSDASDYYYGAEGLAASGKLDDWNQRRPINAALFCVRLAAANFRPDYALWLQMLLLSAALYLVSDAVAARYGVWAGLATFAMLTGYARLYFATTLSESLGITFGAIAAALLIQALHRRSFLLATAGTFGIGLAMSARAGAMFLLPVLVIWAVWQFGPGWRQRLRAAVACCIAIGLAAGVNFAILRLYGNGRNMLGSNFALTFCGLTEGTPWGDVQSKYREELQHCNSEREQASLLYGKAWENIRTSPRVFLDTLWRSESDFLHDLPVFVSSLTTTNQPRWFARSRRLNRVNLFAYCVLGLGAIVTFWRRRREGDYGLAIATSVAVLASMPLIYVDGGWRVLAGSWPLQVIVLSVGFASADRRRVAFADGVETPGDRPSGVPRSIATFSNRWRRLRWPDRLALGLVAVLPLAAILGPWGVHRFSRNPTPQAIAAAQAAHQKLIRCWPQFNAIAVIADDDTPPLGMPAVTLSQFQRFMQCGENADLGSAEPMPATPFVIASAYDFAHGMMFVYGPLSTFSAAGHFQAMNIEPSTQAKRYALVVSSAPVD